MKSNYKYVKAPSGYPGKIYNWRSRILEHHSVWWLEYGEIIDANTHVIHHINENRSDNRIENLQKMTIQEHLSHHNLVYKSKKYICEYCNKNFIRSGKTKSGVSYCSRVCAGKGSIVTNSKNTNIDDNIITQIKNLRQSGLSSYKIAAKLGIARNTVMKYW